MLYTKLPHTNLEVSKICLGTMTWGRQNTEAEAFEQMDYALSQGINFFDTAELYPIPAHPDYHSHTEIIIGNWFKKTGKRKEVVLASKIAGKADFTRFIRTTGFSRESLVEAVEGSLKRLQTDHIDLYFTHWDNEATPVEETLEAYQQLIKDGKVRYIGASNLSPDRVRELLAASEEHGLPKYSVLQPEYSLMEREKFEDGYWEIAKEYEMGVTSYFSLASGFLTGKYRKEEDIKGDRKDIVKKYFSEKGLRVLDQLDAISRSHGVSNAAVALAWIMNRPGITAPIASATKSSHLKAFEEAVQLKLSGEEMEKLNLVSK